MSIRPFLLERYFAKYEFSVKYLMSASDCESLSMNDLLASASPELRTIWSGLKLSYTESQGHEILRSEISKLYKGISSENILVTAPEEGIYITMQTLLNPGDDAIVISPAYQSLHEVARSRGCGIINWQFEKTNNAWNLNIDALPGLITPNTKLLVINFPHNPTGYIPSAEDLSSIVKIASEKGIYIFSDEMYRGLELNPANRLPSVSDLYENGISLSGLSKSFALPGLRIGWLASRNKSLIEKFQSYKDYVSICSSAPSELLGIMALQNKDAILERNNKIVSDNFKVVSEFFDHHGEKFLWLKPSGGSTAFPEWIGDGSVEDLCESLLKKKEVMMVPGSLFEFPGNHFRLGLGRTDFSRALAEFDNYLRES